MEEQKGGRSRGMSSPAVPLTRGGSFSDSKGFDVKGLSLPHSLAQITSFMSTSFPSRGSKKDDKTHTPSPEVATLKEEFERKIAAVVFCLEEKAEENIDLSYKLKHLQQTSKQIEAEKDRVIEDLQKALKAKEEECAQLEKKVANDEVLNELNRRIQTITHCLNDILKINTR
jgi:predicted RNase H-like nuclease (RuvC/YqgF family)